MIEIAEYNKAVSPFERNNLHVNTTIGWKTVAEITILVETYEEAINI
jgi:hypothetical protein